MKVQYASDLHLEFEDNLAYINNNPLMPEGDILILAGDIAYLTHVKAQEQIKLSLLDDFFDYISDHFEQTFLIPGNHEYYHQEDIQPTLENFELHIRPNVSYLNNVSRIHNGVKFIFSTLWSQVGPNFPVHSFSDFYQCRYGSHRLSIQGYNRAHQICRDFMTKEIAKNKKRQPLVVVTHHLPSTKLIAEEYAFSNLNEAFASGSEDLIEEARADCWLFGHSHCNNGPMKIANTQMLSNCLGYVHIGESTGFSGSEVFEI